MNQYDATNSGKKKRNNKAHFYRYRYHKYVTFHHISYFKGIFVLLYYLLKCSVSRLKAPCTKSSSAILRTVTDLSIFVNGNNIKLPS